MEPMQYANSQQVPDRLQKILNILEEYHRLLVHTNTSFTQDPSPSHAYVKSLLRQKGALLQNWLKTRQLPPGVDTDLQEVLEKLKKAIDPWDPNVSTLTQSYVESLFFDCPLTLTLAHCRRLRKQAEEYGTIVDGEVRPGVPTWNDSA